MKRASRLNRSSAMWIVRQFFGEEFQRTVASRPMEKSMFLRGRLDLHRRLSQTLSRPKSLNTGGCQTPVSRLLGTPVQ
jgi:hypothetical protein